jgi:hypothetical protein
VRLALDCLRSVAPPRSREAATLRIVSVSNPRLRGARLGTSPPARHKVIGRPCSELSRSRTINPEPPHAEQ